ncbi:MAG: pantoate--beta-alanine ligase [Desulfurivibrionaceae bacterium]|nr:pantoate--beta-alanine ligase [Desulfurivibrionaceae bacterium]
MEILKTTAEMMRWSANMQAARMSVALVPTMGFFHAGHISLMRMATRKADQVVVSLFVNPAQFGPGEDLTSYPQAFECDVAQARQAGVAVLFCPEPAEMYPPGFQTSVVVGGITRKLCGKSRPHHFGGVTTVVSKLFNLVRPHYAVFGEKDFQQLAVIRRMVVDLNIQVEIIGHHLVREKDGLAMSSRNAYLDRAERQQALCLWHGLQAARQHAMAGERRSAEIIKIARDVIGQHGSCAIEYIEIINKDTLESRAIIDEDVILALAVRIGQTRLIDNGCLLHGEDHV